MECNLIVYGYTDWYLVKPSVKIYFDDEYLGEVIYRDCFEYQIESDGILTFKCNFRKTQIKVYKDKINKIQLQFDDFTGQLKAKILFDKTLAEIGKEKKNVGVQTGNLNTAIEMYKYCVDNGFGSGWNQDWGEKHFELIENSLMDGEEVLMSFIGLHNYINMTEHDSNFAYVITNKRIIMAQKKLIGENLQTVSINNINDITFTSGLAFGILTIDTFKEKFNIALDKTSAKKISEQVHKIFDSLKKKNAEGISNQNTISVADEIKKFKELLDAGVISQEEFNAKKNELLNL